MRSVSVIMGDGDICIVKKWEYKRLLEILQHGMSLVQGGQLQISDGFTYCQGVSKPWAKKP